MNKILILPLLVTLFINGCGSNEKKCFYKIANECVSKQEKENFDLLTSKAYYKKATSSSDTSYHKWVFNEKQLAETTFDDDVEESYSKYSWGLEKKYVLINLGEGLNKYALKDLNKTAIELYDLNHECTQTLYDNVEDALNDDSLSCI